MDTEEIMKLSLKLARLDTVPEDSAIYVKGRGIQKVLFGIDAGVPELLLAKQSGYDAVIAHHPAGGTAVISFHEVFKRHIQQMVRAGIPQEKAKKIVSRKLEQLELDGHTRNYDHALDVARLLKMPYMNIHTPLDEVGRRIMSEQIESQTKKNLTVGDVVAALDKLPEFKNATTKIKIRLGKADNAAGKVVVSHGAGTNGGYDIAKAYFEHGIGTVVYIHVSPADLEKLKAENKGNLIVTGHVASDSVGINPFIRELQQQGISATTVGVVPG
jgi:putative NIF3 family GTP cyclohydrolase 1 type 2